MVTDNQTKLHLEAFKEVYFNSEGCKTPSEVARRLAANTSRTR